MPLSPDAAKVLKEYCKTRPVTALYHSYLAGYQDATWSDNDHTYLEDNKWAIERSRVNICPAVVQGFTSGLTFGSLSGALGSTTAALRFANEQRRADREAWSTGNGFLFAYRDDNGVPHLTSQNSEQVVPIMSEDLPELLYVGKVWSGPKDKSGKATWYVEVYYDTYFMKWHTVNERESVPKEPEAWVEAIITWPGGTTADPLQGELGAPHGFDEIPFVWYRLEASTEYTRGVSVLHHVINLQDLKNKNTADWVIADDKAARMLILALELNEDDDPYSLLVAQGSKTEDEELKLSKNDTLLSMKAASAQQLQAPTTEAFKSFGEANYSDIAAVTGLPEWYLRGKAPENSSYSNTAYLSSRVFARLRSYVEDNKLEQAKALRLLGADAVPAYDVETFTLAQLPAPVGQESK